jgi:hypothetical protein
MRLRRKIALPLRYVARPGTREDKVEEILR